MRKQISVRCMLMLALLFFANSVYASQTSSSTKTSRYDIPLPVLFGVTLADIVPDFGDPRGGGTRTHEGQDIMAPEGTPIVSPVKGTILKFGTAASPGKYVYLKGSDGYLYAFMHLDEIAKLRKNQKVAVGDLLGTVGETGNAKGTTPHLHFEIRKGKPIDPYSRLKKEFSLEDKITYLNAALKDLKNDDALVDLMVNRFNGILLLAEAEDIKLNTAFTKELKKRKGLSIASTSVGLRQGIESNEVEALQSALIQANIGSAAYRLAQTGATGYFGGITRDALLEFQKAFGLPQNGIFTENTKRALLGQKIGEVNGVATTTLPVMHATVVHDLSRGQRGVAVRLLQAFLIHAASGASSTLLQTEGPTGYFGDLTEAALREYQVQNAIPPSGVYDELTRSHMGNQGLTMES